MSANLKNYKAGAGSSIHAPTGTSLSCKGWHQEAALRMLMNNLHPDVAEKPDELIIYGGTGKAARNWECYEKIVAKGAPAMVDLLWSEEFGEELASMLEGLEIDVDFDDFDRNDIRVYRHGHESPDFEMDMEHFAERMEAWAEAFAHQGVEVSTNAAQIRVSPSAAFNPTTQEIFVA